MGKLFVVPISLREANDFVANFHRHCGRTVRNGGKFAIGASDGDGLVGVAIVGNPLSATLMDGYTAEVLRVCVKPGAPKGTNFIFIRPLLAHMASDGRPTFDHLHSGHRKRSVT
ncbi:MAG: hypothetical protein KatS3mg105_3283 [Gemmatales bacterium]|nr:MAG: hypothetical protein KatS3mg105_3283 [Gemmatales bacterium]